MKKNLLLVACAALAAQGLQAAKSVEVTTTSKDMAKYNYEVQACESGNPANCGSIRSISKDAVAKVSVKDGKDAKGKAIKVKSYDLTFFRRNGNAQAILPNIKPGSVVECWDGKAYLKNDASVSVEWESARQEIQRLELSPEQVAKLYRYGSSVAPSQMDESMAQPEAQSATPAATPSYYGGGANYPGAMDLEQARPAAQPTPRYAAPKPAKTSAGYENVNPWFYE